MNNEITELQKLAEELRKQAEEIERRIQELQVFPRKSPWEPPVPITVDPWETPGERTPIHPNPSYGHCPTCGLKLSGTMGYVCMRPNCPTGLNGPSTSNNSDG